MYSPPADPDPERLALVFSILRSREAGESYHEIARDLGLSPGGAHHLANDLLKAREEAARGLVRQPSRYHKGHQPDPFVVLGELRADMRRTEPLLCRYPDPDDVIDRAINDGDRIYDDSRGRVVRALSGEAAGDVADELTAIDGAYTELLELAHRLDATLQSEVDAGSVLNVFHADLLLIAEVTGADISEPAEAWVEHERSLRPIAPPARGPERKRLGKEEQRSRDEAIVRARSAGTPENSVAHAHGISKRQVRRIVANFRHHHSGAAPAAIAAVEEAVDKVDAEIAELQDVLVEEDLSPTRRDEAARLMARSEGRKLEIYRVSGLLSPDTYRAATAARQGAHLDLVPKLNAGIREVLGRHGIDEEIIDEVADRVIADAGIEIGGGGEIAA